MFFTMGRLNRLEELLGEELVVEHGEREIVRTMEALQGEGLVVGLYFDAYFSSENREIHPGLVHFWTLEKNADRNFEVVYVPCDEDEASYELAMSETPWFAIPFGSEKIAYLRKRYLREGRKIPHMVFIDASGHFIHEQLIHELEQLEVAELSAHMVPLNPRPFLNIVRDSCLLNSQRLVVDSPDVLEQNDILAIFIANPRAEGFQELAKLVDELQVWLKQERKQAQVIFACDSDVLDAFDGSMASSLQNCLAFAPDETSRCELQCLWRLHEVPALVTVDSKSGTLIRILYHALHDSLTTQREDFPWELPLVPTLPQGQAHMQRHPSLVVFPPRGARLESAFVEDLKTLSAAEHSKRVESGLGTAHDRFPMVFIAQCPLSADQGGDQVRVAIFDDPNQQQFLLCPSGALPTLDELNSFVQLFEEGVLEPCEEALVPTAVAWREGATS